jgi:hypothetical protein
MEKNLIILIFFILAAIAVTILVIRRNYKDRKGLFKKLTGDYPDPKEVKSELILIIKLNYTDDGHQKFFY